MLETESEIIKRKEGFRLRHRKANNAKEDVMRRYYGIERNRNATVRIDAPELEAIACSLFHSSHPDYYVNPMPCQLSERMRRSGEVMVWE